MTLNFFRTCTVASAAIATAFLLHAPAQASGFASVLTFTGEARFENADTNLNGISTLNFDPFDNVNAGLATTGNNSPIAPQEVFDIKDLELVKTADGEWSLNSTEVVSFLSNFSTTTGLEYRLTQFDLRQATDNSFSADLAGWLNDGNGEVFYTGAFSSQPALLSSIGTTFSGNLDREDVASVPTPAMLPGLLTVTLGMVRKRKEQSA